MSRSRAVLQLCLGFLILGFALFNLNNVRQDLGPAVRFAQGEGRPGTFLAERLACGRGCLWYGDFTDDAGVAARRDVYIQGYDDGGDLTVGQRVRAVDTGSAGNVFRPGTTPNWLGLFGTGLFFGVFFGGGGLVLVIRAIANLRRELIGHGEHGHGVRGGVRGADESGAGDGDLEGHLRDR